MKIGIFTAMQKEAASFLKNGAEKISVGNFNVWFFKLGSHDAVLCCPPAVGEIAAASACQLLISRFKVDVVLNFGVVGALTRQASVFSTVLVGSVVHYDFDVSAIDGVPVGRYPNFEDIAVQCDNALLRKASAVIDLPVVRCASADKFVSETEAKNRLRDNFKADICDMESAGLLFACRYNNVPCLLVKVVSDSLSDPLHDYETNALAAAANFFDLAEKIADVL